MKRNGISPASFLGLLLMAAALLLCLRNAREDTRAGETVRRAAAQLETWAPEQKRSATNPVLTGEMPVITIEGRTYIGTLEIPALKRNLAVLADCTAEGLKTAPGRYSGSVYTDDLVICAHNYDSHFGRIGELTVGETLIFTDGAGKTYSFRVERLEILPPDAVEEMIRSPWDLTLFTCTPGGAQRITVRCMNMRIKDTQAKPEKYE